ncbi:MAG: formyltetrahydrofolate deformylase [Acidimicrobiales bacterium]
MATDRSAEDDAVSEDWSLGLILTVRSPDRVGIVANLAAAVQASGGNIIELDQHTDVVEGDFGCRVEVAGGVDARGLADRLDDLRTTLAIDFTMTPLARPRARVAVLCSTTLHCPSDLIARSAIGQLDCDIVALVSDRTTGRELAERYDVPFTYLPVGDDRTDQERQLGVVLGELSPDLIVLARYMRVLPGWLVERYEHRIINIHHSFLPAFIGSNPYARAHERGVKIIGATAHYVTAELDAGPIIAQDVVHISHRDDVADMTRRGADIERSVLASAIRLHLEQRVIVFGTRTCVFD